jgi:hypothetical protein
VTEGRKKRSERRKGVTEGRKGRGEEVKRRSKGY